MKNLENLMNVSDRELVPKYFMKDTKNRMMDLLKWDLETNYFWILMTTSLGEMKEDEEVFVPSIYGDGEGTEDEDSNLKMKTFLTKLYGIVIN